MDKKFLKIITAWFIFVILTAWIGFSVLPSGQLHGKDSFAQSFANWDGGHYLGIAENGYKNFAQYAFFPLYPLLIKLVSNVSPLSPLWSALFISYLATFSGLYIFFKLAQLEVGKKSATTAVTLFLMFPSSFYLLTVYSEGLFFMLAVLTFYLALQKKFALATLVAGAASATRLAGIAVILALWVESFKTKKGKQRWVTLLAPSGLFLYMFFLYKQTGNPFAFLEAEQNWQRGLTLPVLGLFQSFAGIFAGIANYFNYPNWKIPLESAVVFADTASLIFGIGLSVKAFKLLKPHFAIFALTLALLPLFTPTLSSITRYTLVIFPVFLMLGLLTTRRIWFNSNRSLKLFFAIYGGFCLVLLTLFITLFINGYWVS